MPDATKKSRERFYLIFSLVLLAIVLGGFAPTLYLRPLFDVPPIPNYLYLHGLALTAWFAWLCVQTVCVAANRTDLHRRFGVFGLFIATAVVVSGLYVSLEFAPRLAAKFGDISSSIGFVSLAVWANFGMLVAYLVFLVIAVVNRSSPPVHKRLMLLASFSIISPALARVGRYTVAGVPEEMVGMIGLLLLLGALLIYDRKRLLENHKVTLLGSALLIAVFVIFAFFVAPSEFGKNFVESTV